MEENKQAKRSYRRNKPVTKSKVYAIRLDIDLVDLRLFLRLLVRLIVQAKKCRIVRLTLLASVMLCLFDPDKTNGK